MFLKFLRRLFHREQRVSSYDLARLSCHFKQPAFRPITTAEWFAMVAEAKTQCEETDEHWEKHGFPEAICPWCQFERGEISGVWAQKIAEDLTRPITLNRFTQPADKPGARSAFLNYYGRL